MSGFICISGGLTKKDLHPLEFRQQIRQRAHGAAAIKLADEGHAQSIERTLAVDRVQIKQGLRGMLAAVAISRIDDGHRRDFGRPPAPPVS